MKTPCCCYCFFFLHDWLLFLRLFYLLCAPIFGESVAREGAKIRALLRARAAKIEMLGRLFVVVGAFSYAAHHMCEKVESHDFFQEFPFFFLPPPIFSHTQFLSAARPLDQGEESVILLVVGGLEGEMF